MSRLGVSHDYLRYKWYVPGKLSSGGGRLASIASVWSNRWEWCVLGPEIVLIYGWYYNCDQLEALSHRPPPKSTNGTKFQISITRRKAALVAKKRGENVEEMFSFCGATFWAAPPSADPHINVEYKLKKPVCCQFSKHLNQFCTSIHRRTQKAYSVPHSALGLLCSWSHTFAHPGSRIPGERHPVQAASTSTLTRHQGRPESQSPCLQEGVCRKHPKRCQQSVKMSSRKVCTVQEHEGGRDGVQSVKWSTCVDVGRLDSLICEGSFNLIVCFGTGASILTATGWSSSPASQVGYWAKQSKRE